jgi:hypothetical protein
MPAGYSGTPLAKKLGYKPGMIVFWHNPPSELPDWLEPLPPDVVRSGSVSREVDLVHFFTTSATELAEALRSYRERLRSDAVLWISWPKKASKVPTDVTEDTIREHCLPLGWVDIKVCAVSAVWSGLKLVLRKELR